MSQTKAQLIDNLVQPITGALGSASAPTFSFTADPNTGVYSPGADQLAFSTGGTGRLFIDASGRVGIGTTGPSYTLDVNGSIRLDGSSLANGLSSSGNLNINTGTGTGSATQLIFNIDDTERARIDSSGRLLVGNSTARVGEPQGGSVVGYTLSSTFEGTSTVPGSVSAIQNSAFAAYDGPYFYFARTRGTLVGSSTIVASGDNLGTIAFAGADGTDIRTKAAEIYAQVDGTPGANDMPGRLVFSTTADGASTPTERMRIDSAGDITIAGGGLIKADFTNATAADRTYFQTSSTNGFTAVGAIPNGTNTTSTFYAFNDSNPTNASYCGVVATPTAAVVRSSATGTGTLMPLTFETNNQEQARFTTTDRYFRMASGTGGIQFKGDTAAANALDDYEEGTFTPTIIGVTTPGTGTYSVQTGRYTRIGRIVQIQLRLVWSAHTGTGLMRISALPFTVVNGSGLAAASLHLSNITSPANTIVQMYALINSADLIFTSVPIAGGASANLALDTAGDVMVGIVYEAA